MKIISPAGFLAVLISMTATGSNAQVISEPGATPGVELVNLSNNTADNRSSLFMNAAVSRSNPNLVAVAWRTYGLPVDTNAFREHRVADCHLSISTDGGGSFIDRNMMDDINRYRFQGANPIRRTLLSGCNSPWVEIARDNTIYYGGWMLEQNSVNHSPEVIAAGEENRALVMASSDLGATWPTNRMSVSIELDRFPQHLFPRNNAGNPATRPPGDGHFGAVDQQSGILYAGTRVFGAVSENQGRTWSTIYQAKGTVAAGFGAVVGAQTVNNIPGRNCPCLEFSLSHDKGRTFTSTILAEANGWSSIGTVRYPIAVVSPEQAGHYAVTAYAPDHQSVRVYYTTDGGANWKLATPGPVPANVPVNNVNQMGVGYTSDGRILVTWRGFRNPGAFNTFVAMLDGEEFGKTVKVSPELSVYPPLTYMGNYNRDGAGDFTTWVVGNNTHAFVAFPYSPYGADGTVIADTYVARIPLQMLE